MSRTQLGLLIRRHTPAASSNAVQFSGRRALVTARSCYFPAGDETRARNHVRRTYRSSLSPRSWQLQQRRRAVTVTDAVDVGVGSEPTGPAQQQELVERLYHGLTRDPAISGVIPNEEEVLSVLETYEEIVDKQPKRTDEERRVPGQEVKHGSSNATSAMLGTMHKDQAGSPITSSEVMDNISNRATQILEAPTIFISPKIIASYIRLQSSLQQPLDFPSIFSLYHSKPSPQPLDKPPHVTFTSPNPNTASAAIPPEVAEMALDAAIKFHSLPLCLSIIAETYSHTSFAKYKFMKKALVPAVGAAVAPFAAYTLASQFAVLQTTMDPSQATTMAMMGIMTYVSVVGSMGYVAVTTANDQMVRVTWSSGVPLWERWIREEERAAVDKVAQAWGFKSRTKWGDEEGDDWDELREWTGVRGMILDKVEFMQGMQ